MVTVPYDLQMLQNSIKIPDNKATALVIEEADNAYITFDSRDDSELITISKATTFSGAVDINSTVNINNTLSLDGTANELRFYEGANYVGFEAPSLSGDQIWVLPNADGSANQVLQTNGGGDLTWADLGISNVVDDTSPQLGGNLDVNGKDIVSTSNGDIELSPNGTGKVIFKGNATGGSGRFVLNCENNSHGITIQGPQCKC